MTIDFSAAIFSRPPRAAMYCSMIWSVDGACPEAETAARAARRCLRMEAPPSPAALEAGFLPAQLEMSGTVSTVGGRQLRANRPGASAFSQLDVTGGEKLGDGRLRIGVGPSLRL